MEVWVIAPAVGSSVQQVKDLCRHDKEALDLVIEWTTKKPGAPVGNTNASKEDKTNTDNVSNCSKRNEKHGNSLDYTLRRLRKGFGRKSLKSRETASYFGCVFFLLGFCSSLNVGTSKRGSKRGLKPALTERAKVCSLK